MEHPGLSLSVVLRYLILPLAWLALATLLHTRTGRPRTGAFDRGPWAVWWLIVTFWMVYGIMGYLHYRAYRTTIQDLGVYDQRLWVLSRTWPFPSPGQIVSIFGHFSPILALHVLAYKLYPSAVVLIALQVAAVGLGAYPLYHLAERRVGSAVALALAAAYLLYPSVVFTVLFDFHPDHLVIPLLLFAYYFLDVGNRWGLAVSGALMLLIKESIGPTVAAFGVYAILVARRYRLGAVLALGSLAFLGFVILPRYPALFSSGAGGESYGYLGASAPEILRTVLTSPGLWVPEIVQVPKLKFLFLMLAPLMFLPLLAPAVMLVALPGLLMALLSRHPHRYQIWTQYMAPLIPPLFAGAVFGSERLAARFARGPVGGRRMGTLLPLWIIATALYFNVVFSPSPLSTTFWAGEPEWLRWPFHFRAYVVGRREQEIREALQRHVPADSRVSVASQNNINASYLAHRAVYTQVPDEASYVVVDVKRPLFIYDRIDPAAFDARLAQLRRERPILYESDGFLIFGPSAPATTR